MPYLIEGIVTTQNGDGTHNVAPMGPIVPADDQLLFRPFQTSRTFSNLMQHRSGVFHWIDDVLLLTRAALNIEVSEIATVALEGSANVRLADCCQWSEFEIVEVETSEQRSEMLAQVMRTEVMRPFQGWNRATHAVLELVIKATRLRLLPREDIEQEKQRTQVVLEKTASEREYQAYELVNGVIEGYYREQQT